MYDLHKKFKGFDDIELENRKYEASLLKCEEQNRRFD